MLKFHPTDKQGFSSMNKTENDTGFSEEKNYLSFIEEAHTEVKFSLKIHPFTAESITVKKELDDFGNRKTANEVNQNLDQKLIIKSEEETLEAHTEIHLSLKSHPFTAESITVKKERNDFDNGKTVIELNQDLDPKSTIKSDEETFINNQYLIDHEEVTIKSDDDVEQSDNWVENHKVKDQIKIYKCPDCPYESNVKGNVKKHLVRHSKPDEIVWHRCTECPYKTIRKDNLKQHAIRHNESGQFDIFKCLHCVYESSKKQNLKRHLLMLHGENIARINCPEPECPYKTNVMSKLKRHSQVHSSDKFFKCTQCSYQAKRQEYLKRHQLNHESTDKWHACPQCPFKTTRKNNLNKHVRTHANPVQLKWYMCEQCSYKTYQKHNFIRHELTHNYAKWLQCTSCLFKTMRKAHFRQHQLRHRDDDFPDWHKCSECPYKSIRKENLLKHAKNHNAADRTGWQQCPECSYRTRLINNLQTHQMLHTGVVEWFCCFDCPYKTNWKPSLVFHVKTHLQTGQDKLP